MRGDRRIRYTLLLLLLIVSLAACRQSAQPTPTTVPAAANVSIELTTDPTPPVPGDATLIVTVKDGEQPVAGVDVAAHGDMTHAGMQPVDASGETDENGVARIPFKWTMGGDWIVTITATLPEGADVEKVFNLSIGG